MKEEEIGADEEAKKGLGFDVDNAFFGLVEDKKYSTPLSEEEKKLLVGRKRKDKKKLKEIGINLFGRKKKAKLEPGKLQQILNKVIRTNDFSSENITTTAGKINYRIDKESIKLITELGKAKASIRKIGVPSNICKKKLHIFSFIKLFKNLNVITDDRIIWNCFLGTQYFEGSENAELVKYKNFYDNIFIKSFSIVSTKIFKNNKAIYGYCQDTIKDVALISEEIMTDDKIKDFAQKIEAKSCDFISKSILPNTSQYDYYSAGYAAMCIPFNSNVANYLNLLKTVKCVHSKNNLITGLKEAKVNNQVGSYLNLHDIKLTDFSPACLFVSDNDNFKTFIDAELDYNTVYNNIVINDGTTLLNLLDLPKDCVFWDNISSFMELLGLINVTKKIPDGLSKDITSTIEMYNQYKFAFSAWKSVYKTFENIILSFYDSVTTKLTIDGVTKLQEKVDNFLSNYYLLKNHYTYSYIGIILTKFKFASMMKTFYSQTAASDAISSIKKVITVLISGSTESLNKEITIEEMFRTTGIMCLECLYDGYWAMIPKIRSKVSFLGNVGGDIVSDENLRNNIKIIQDLFEKKNAAAKEDINDPRGFLAKKEEYDNLIDRTLENTLNSYKESSKAVNKYKDTIKKTILLDPVLYSSMLEDISTFMSDPDYQQADLLAYGNFLDNPDVMDFLSKSDKLIDLAWEYVKNWDTNKLFKSINTKRNPKKKIIFKNSLGRIKNRKAAPSLKTVTGNSQIDSKQVIASFSALEDKFKDKQDDVLKFIQDSITKINAKAV